MLRRALELEKQIEDVQKSTKTLFKFFVPLHNWLRMKSKAYYNWSLKPYSHSIHWAVLVLFIIAAPLVFMASNGRPEKSEAAAGTVAGDTFYSTQFIDPANTTAKIDLANRKVRMAYEQEPTVLGSLSVPYEYISGGDSHQNMIFVEAAKSNVHKDTIYIFGSKTSNYSTGVIKVIPSDGTVTLLKSSVTGNAPPSTASTKLAYDYDDGIVVFYDSDNTNTYYYNFNTDQYSLNPANNASNYFHYNFPGDAKNPPAANDIAGSMPVYIPKSSASQYAGKVLFVGGKVKGTSIGIRQVTVYDPLTNSFVGKFDSGLNIQMPNIDANGGVVPPDENSNNFGIAPSKAKAGKVPDPGDGNDNTNGGGGPIGPGQPVYYEVYANNLYGGNATYYKDGQNNERIAFTGALSYYYLSNSAFDSNGTQIDVTGSEKSGVGSFPSALTYNFSNISQLDGVTGCNSKAEAVVGVNTPQIFDYTGSSSGSINLRMCSLGGENSTRILTAPLGFGTALSAAYAGNNKVYLLSKAQSDYGGLMISVHDIPTGQVTDGSVDFGTSTFPKSGFATILKDSMFYLAGGSNNQQSLYAFDPVAKSLQKSSTSSQTDPYFQSTAMMLGAYAGDSFYTFRTSGGRFNPNGSYLGDISVTTDPTGTSPSTSTVSGVSPTDLTNDLWIPYPGSAAAVAYDGKVYLIGSFKSGASNLSVVYLYDPESNSITQVADISSVIPYGSSSYKVAAVGKDNMIYVFYSNKIIKFDPVHYTFTTLNQTLSSPYSQPSSTTLINSSNDKSKIYIAQGKMVSVFDVDAQTLYTTGVRFNYYHFLNNSLAGGIAGYGNSFYYFGGGDTTKIETADLRVKPDSNIVQSLRMNGNTQNTDYYKAYFSAQCLTSGSSCNYTDGRSIKFEITKDGGTHWQEVDNNSTLIFPSTYAGNDLRWRATLTGTTYSTPEITKVNLTYYGTQAKLYIEPSYPSDTKAGVATGQFNVRLRDLNSINTVANKDTTVQLTTTSSKGRFSTSPNGPWTSTLQLTISTDQESAPFYYVDYETGRQTITASSDGLSPSVFIHTTLVGDLGPTSSIKFNNPVQAGQTTPVDITLLDGSGNTISGKTVRIYSSNPKDNIASPDSTTVDGKASGSITATTSGDRTISVLDVTDNTWLESQPTLTVLPGSLDSVDLSSSQKETIQAGARFSAIVSLLDGYKNKINSAGTVSLSSTDPSFQNQKADYNSSNGGTITFQDLSLKTSGDQTITATDIKSGKSDSFKLKVLNGVLDSSQAQFTTDKSKLLLNNHDKANLTIKLTDAYGNGVPNVNVHIKENFQFGTLSATNETTDGNGTTTFVYTPNKIGKETLSAYTDTFDIKDKVVIDIVADTLGNQLGNLLDSLQSNPIAKKIAGFTNALVAATASIGLIPIIAGVIGSAPAAAHAVTYAFSLGLEAIGAKKRRRSWGRVYDSTTGKGIDMATVRLFENESMKLVSTVVTDLKGHFSFQPPAGKYTISVIKDNYVFPTNIFAKYGIATIDKSASRINSHYVGQMIEVSSNNNLINLEIPIDPHNKKPNFTVRAKVFLSDFFEMITSGLSYIFIPSIVFGILLSIFAAIILPTTRNLTICLTYVLVALLYVISHLVKAGKFSVVYDSRDKKPIPEAVVSIFDNQYDTLKETRITDKFGRFSISIPKGRYKIKVEREGFVFPSIKVKRHWLNDRRYTGLYFGDILEAKKEKFINISVPMDEKYGELTIK